MPDRFPLRHRTYTFGLELRADASGRPRIREEHRSEGDGARAETHEVGGIGPCEHAPHADDGHVHGFCAGVHTGEGDRLEAWS